MQKDQNSQNFMMGAAILALGVVIMKILGAIYKIPLQNILGDTGYGYFYAAYTIFNVMLTASTAGFPVALSRMISEANTLNRPRQEKRIFGVATATLAILGIFFSCVTFLFPRQMAVTFVSKEEVSFCVYALSPSMILLCLNSVFCGYIQGHGNMKPTTVGQVLETLVKVIVGLALAVFFVHAGKSVEISAAGAIFGVACGGAATLIYMFWSFMRIYRKAWKERIAESSDVPDSIGSTLKKFLKVGLAITLGACVMSLISLIDTKLIQLQLPHVQGFTTEYSDELYGCYCAMQTLFNVPAAFITPMTIAIVPAISAATASRDHHGVCSIAGSGLRVSAALAMPMGIGLAVLSKPIVGVLYPTTNAMGPTILSLMGAASIFVCIALVTNAILQANGHEKQPVVSMICGGVVKIGANLLFVHQPSINILGACIGTICCYLVICLLNCISIYRHFEEKPAYLSIFFRPFIASAVMGVAAWAVYAGLGTVLNLASSRILMLLAMLISIAIAVFVYIVMVILTKSITLEDMKLIPKGEKIAHILHIR